MVDKRGDESYVFTCFQSEVKTWQPGRYWGGKIVKKGDNPDRLNQGVEAQTSE